MADNERKILRCAIYTRKSSEHGLEQDFNSLHAQREAAEAYIKSQAHEGWKLIKTSYNDGGISGGTLERPALQSLLSNIGERKIDVVVVYKVDRLTRSLADFAKLVEMFEAHGVSFVSVTQQFNTTTSMGRLTLNVLLSFAQFEREIAGERIRDKVAASKRKGMWMGGTIPLGYDVKDRKLVVNDAEAETVRLVFQRYLTLGCVSKLRAHLNDLDVRSKQRTLKSGHVLGGGPIGAGALYHLLRNRIYRGEVAHKGAVHPGEHAAIMDEELWNAVQVKLSGNISKRRQTQIASGALLGGLLFDDKGNRMSPSYTARKAGRYRYYISQAVLRGRKEQAGSLARVGADSLEQIVVGTLRRGTSPGGTETEPASGVWSPEIRNLVQSSVERIVIHDHEIEIVLKTMSQDHSAASVDENNDGGSSTILRIPLPAPRSRERKQILIPSIAGSAPHRVDQSLVLALARARSWMQALRRGKYVDTGEIARRFGLSDAHVRRVVRLAFLAPDIVESIVEGRQPRVLTVKLLLPGIPFDWAEQRAALGFAR
jgi:DNA invertase Pin-like site-specific DNA recombinase